MSYDFINLINVDVDVDILATDQKKIWATFWEITGNFWKISSKLWKALIVMDWWPRQSVEGMVFLGFIRLMWIRD